MNLRLAARTLLKSPGFSFVVVLTLALGIGANTAIFSFVDTMLLKRLPVRSPHELYQVARVTRQQPSVSWNYPDYCAFRDRVHAFSGLVAYSGPQQVGLQVEDGTADATELAGASLVSGNYFDVLGVRAAAGHLLSAADDAKFGAAPYAVLGFDYWQRRFGGDPAVLNQVMTVNGQSMTVVGVGPRGFSSTTIGVKPAVYAPITMRGFSQPFKGFDNRRSYWAYLFARLKPALEDIKAHDIAAAIAIVREAGGTVTDFDGGQGMLESGYIVASNGLIHQPMLDVLKQAHVKGKGD